MAGEAFLVATVAPLIERFLNATLGDPALDAQRKDDLFNKIIEQSKLGVDPSKLLGSSKDLEGFFGPERTALLMGIPKTQAFQQRQQKAQQDAQLAQFVGQTIQDIERGVSSSVLQFPGGQEQAQTQLPQAPITPTPGVTAQQPQLQPTPEGPTLGRRPPTTEERLGRIEGLSLRQLSFIDAETAKIEQARQSAEGRQMSTQARISAGRDITRRETVLKLFERGIPLGAARTITRRMERGQRLSKKHRDLVAQFADSGSGIGSVANQFKILAMEASLEKEVSNLNAWRNSKQGKAADREDFIKRAESSNSIRIKVATAKTGSLDAVAAEFRKNGVFFDAGGTQVRFDQLEQPQRDEAMAFFRAQVGVGEDDLSLSVENDIRVQQGSQIQQPTSAGPLESREAFFNQFQ